MTGLQRNYSPTSTGSLRRLTIRVAVAMTVAAAFAGSLLWSVTLLAAFTPQGAAADIQVFPLAVSLTSSSTPSQCQSPVLGDPEAPVITGVQHSIHPANSLIFDFGVDLNSPARLWVEYWPADGAGGVVRTALTDQSDTHHDLQVMRLYFDTEYCYQVYATTGSSPETESTGGALVSESVPGWFTTGSVPPALADAQFVRTFGGQSYDLTLMEYNDTGFPRFPT